MMGHSLVAVYEEDVDKNRLSSAITVNDVWVIHAPLPSHSACYVIDIDSVHHCDINICDINT